MGCNKIPERMKIGKEKWGHGWILEDIWIEKKENYEDWEPHVQAIKNEEGDLALRFCYWHRKSDGSRGDFVRSPMFVYDWTMDDLRNEVVKHRAEIILMLFKKLAGQS